MNAAEFRDEIKKGLSGAYLFYGDEEYTKAHSLSLARKSIGMSEFNYNRISGEGKDIFQIISSLDEIFMTPSFMAEKKLTELQETMLLKPDETEIEHLCECVSRIKDDPFNVLIIYTNPQEFDSGAEKKPSKMLKALSGNLKAVYFPKETISRLAVWAGKHFEANGVKASSEICSILIDHCGKDMCLLSNEIDKTSYYVLENGRNEVTKDDIHNVCSTISEIDAFDFSNAILSGDNVRAFSILSYMKGRREEPVLILRSISKIFTDLCIVKSLMMKGLQKSEIAQKMKMHEYPVSLRMKAASGKQYGELSKAVRLCFETDRKIKSTPADKYLLIEMLIVRISSNN